MLSQLKKYSWTFLTKENSTILGCFEFNEEEARKRVLSFLDELSQKGKEYREIDEERERIAQEYRHVWDKPAFAITEEDKELRIFSNQKEAELFTKKAEILKSVPADIFLGYVDQDVFKYSREMEVTYTNYDPYEQKKLTLEECIRNCRPQISDFNFISVYKR